MHKNIDGPKYVQMGGLVHKIERIADSIVHIPSPQISPGSTEQRTKNHFNGGNINGIIAEMASRHT